MHEVNHKRRGGDWRIADVARPRIGFVKPIVQVPVRNPTFELEPTAINLIPLFDTAEDWKRER